MTDSRWSPPTNPPAPATAGLAGGQPQGVDALETDGNEAESEGEPPDPCHAPAAESRAPLPPFPSLPPHPPRAGAWPPALPTGSCRGMCSTRPKEGRCSTTASATPELCADAPTVPPAPPDAVPARSPMGARQRPRPPPRRRRPLRLSAYRRPRSMDGDRTRLARDAHGPPALQPTTRPPSPSPTALAYSPGVVGPQ